MFKKIWNWFLRSHRWQHLLLGMLIGLGCNGWYMTEYVGCGVSGALEFKDYKYHQGWDWIDFVLTLIGVNLGYLVRWDILKMTGWKINLP